MSLKIAKNLKGYHKNDVLVQRDRQNLAGDTDKR